MAPATATPAPSRSGRLARARLPLLGALAAALLGVGAAQLLAPPAAAASPRAGRAAAPGLLTEAGAIHLASGAGAAAARAALACGGEGHLVLSTVALESAEHLEAPPLETVHLDGEGLRARTDAGLRERVASACCVELRGGDLASWWHALFPGGERSPLSRALYAAWRRGTPLLGVDAGAAFLCGGGPAVTGRWPLEEHDRKDDDPRGRALTGLGLGPLPLLAWGDDAATGPAALLDSMERYGLETVAWLEGAVWLEFLPRTREVTVHGPGRLALLVLDGPHRARQVIGPLWELGDGCRWQPWLQRVVAPTGARPLEGVLEERRLGDHSFEVHSRPGSQQHLSSEDALPSRLLLAVRLLREGSVGRDRLPQAR